MSKKFTDRPKVDPEDVRIQAIASGLEASGFTPEDIAELLVQLRKNRS